VCTVGTHLLIKIFNTCHRFTTESYKYSDIWSCHIFNQCTAIFSGKPTLPVPLGP